MLPVLAAQQGFGFDSFLSLTTLLLIPSVSLADTRLPSRVSSAKALDYQIYQTSHLLLKLWEPIVYKQKLCLIRSLNIAQNL